MIHVRSPAGSAVATLEGTFCKGRYSGSCSNTCLTHFGADDQRISETNGAFWLNRPNSIVIHNRSVVILEYCCCRSVGFVCRIEELPKVVGV